MSEKNVVELDDRPIAGIYYGTDDDIGYTVGRQDVTAIKVCYVVGEMAHVPWLEVWKGDVLCDRVRCGAVTDVAYGEPPA